MKEGGVDELAHQLDMKGKGDGEGKDTIKFFS